MQHAGHLACTQEDKEQDVRVQAKHEPCLATACLKETSSVSIPAQAAYSQKQQHAQHQEQGRVSMRCCAAMTLDWRYTSKASALLPLLEYPAYVSSGDRQITSLFPSNQMMQALCK